MPRKPQEFIPDEFVDALGMSTNVFNPGPKTARRLLNVHTHEEPGKIKIRPGYTLKYNNPTASYIENVEFMNFDMFYDRQIDVAGKEVTCLIQKGKIKHLARFRSDRR